MFNKGLDSLSLFALSLFVFCSPRPRTLINGSAEFGPSPGSQVLLVSHLVTLATCVKTSCGALFNRSCWTFGIPVRAYFGVKRHLVSRTSAIIWLIWGFGQCPNRVTMGEKEGQSQFLPRLQLQQGHPASSQAEERLSTLRDPFFKPSLSNDIHVLHQWFLLQNHEKNKKNVNKIPSLLQASFFQKSPAKKSPTSPTDRSFFQQTTIRSSRFGGVVHQLQPGKRWGGLCGICDIKIQRGLVSKNVSLVCRLWPSVCRKTGRGIFHIFGLFNLDSGMDSSLKNGLHDMIFQVKTCVACGGAVIGCFGATVTTD